MTNEKTIHPGWSQLCWPHSFRRPEPRHRRTATSAPLTDIRYEVTFTRANGARRTGVIGDDVHRRRKRAGHPVAARVDTRSVRDLQLRSEYLGLRGGGRRATRSAWDKIDQDTWRISPTRRGRGDGALRLSRRQPGQREQRGRVPIFCSSTGRIFSFIRKEGGSAFQRQ